MAKKIRSIDDIRPNVFEAIKRAYIRRGWVSPGRRPAPDVPKAKTSSVQNQAKKVIEQNAEPTDSQETANPERQETQEKLLDITVKAQDVLFEADTIFPFTIFPDTISLDREKLTVATRAFFRTAKIISVPVSSMLSAESDVGPFFGSVHMTSKFFVQNAYSVNFLWRKDAIKIQHLLQGFIIAHEKKLDTTDVEKEDLLILLNDLGQGVTD